MDVADRIADVPYTRNRDLCSENLRSYAVEKVQFSEDGATLVSEDKYGRTICWDVATGARKDEVAGQFASTKAEIGRYIVTMKDDLVLVYDTQGGVVNANGEEFEDEDEEEEEAEAIGNVR